MSIGHRIKSLLGLNRKPSSSQSMRLRRRGRSVSAAYDAVSESALVSRYWKNADTLSADGANSASVRRTLRSRARYECLEANSFAKGMVHTLANDTIGTGPRLQLTTPDRPLNQQVDQAFASWAKQVRLARKLRTLRVAKCVDGEAFAYFTTNTKIPSPVQVDISIVEADQIATPFASFDANAIDGIIFDDDGNPLEYHKLRHHPGSSISWGLEYDRLPAESVIHLFQADRPGQHRGIPEVTTALPLFALLRDYTLAVLQNARSVAKFTALLKTNASAIDDDGNNWDPTVEPFDVVDIDYDMITALPHGWDISQLKAEQPTTTFQMFRDAILNEIARCLNMPFNIAAGNSAGYNYSSGRLDHQTYYKAIVVERSEWEIACLDRVFGAWLDEALLTGTVRGLGTFQSITDVPHQWTWDGHEHIDPVKEATAQQTRLASKTTTLASEYANAGKNWEKELRQIAREQQLISELGLGADGRADMAEKVTSAMTKYVTGRGEELMPPAVYLRDVLGMNEDQVTEILKELEAVA